MPKEYKTHYDYFAKLCIDGIKNRYGISNEEIERYMNVTTQTENVQSQNSWNLQIQFQLWNV